MKILGFLSIGGTATSLLATLHVINVCLGVCGGILAIIAGILTILIKWKQYKRFNQANSKVYGDE